VILYFVLRVSSRSFVPARDGENYKASSLLLLIFVVLYKCALVVVVVVVVLCRSLLLFYHYNAFFLSLSLSLSFIFLSQILSAMRRINLRPIEDLFPLRRFLVPT
jgi:hypothetical protein